MVRLLLPILFFAVPAWSAPVPSVTALAYHPQGAWLLAGVDKRVAIIDVAKGEVTTFLDQPGKVTSLAYSRDGQVLAVASGEASRRGVIQLYKSVNQGAGYETLGLLEGHKDLLYALDFSPDGKLLASAGYDRSIHVWDVATRKLVRELKDHSDTVYGLSFHPSGKLLASAAADRAVKVWQVDTGKRLYTLGDPTDWVYTVTWSPDGSRLAAAGVDKSIRVWKADAEGGKLIHSVFADTQPVTKLIYSQDGKTVYSMSEAKNLKRWDAAKMVEQFVFPTQKESLLALAVRPDGKQLAVGRFDGVCQLLDPVSAKSIAEPLPIKPKPPTLTRLVPNHATLGNKVKIAVEGTNFDDMEIVVPPGIQARWLNAGTATQREVELTLLPTAPVGNHKVTLKSKIGTSNAADFFVDRYPLLTEAAGSDSASQAKLIQLPGTVGGTLVRAGETDHYRFACRPGEAVGVQLLPVGTPFDPVLELLNSTGKVVAEGEGTLAYRSTQSEELVLSVRDRDFRGGAGMGYRLHAGPIPIVSQVFPLGVQRGTEATVTLEGVNLPVQSVKVKVPADAVVGSRFPIPIPGDVKPLGDASIVVGEFPEVIAQELATHVATPGTANGRIARPGEKQTLTFLAKKGEPLIVEVQARRIGSPLDSFIEILDAQDKPVGQATLRCVARTFVTFRDHDSTVPGIRLETWNELAMDDYVYVGNELLRIQQLPLNPDADCSFYTVGGRRVGYLGTTPAHLPNNEPMYKVEIHPPGKTFPPNGMPVFQLAYRNDDGGSKEGKDSLLLFDPPSDGEYRVRVSDSRGQAGPRFGYRLTVRTPRPDFSILAGPVNASVPKGGSISINVNADRVDQFDGPIRLQVENLPTGFEAPTTFIEKGQLATSFPLYARADAVVTPKAPPAKIVARGIIQGKEVVREFSLGVPRVIDVGDLVTITSSQEVLIKPGQQAKLLVKIERRNGFKGRVPLEVKGLPHGVRVLDIGLNGILITERDSEREIVFYAEPWVEAMDHPLIVLARREGKNTEHGAPSVLLKVRK
jgi:Tol biopolymer transport system component